MALGSTRSTTTATAAATTKTTALNIEVFDNQRRRRIINYTKIELQELRFRKKTPLKMMMVLLSVGLCYQESRAVCA